MNISKEYFTSITKEVEKIIDLYESLCNNESFLNKIKKDALPHYPIDSIKEVIFDCFFIDMAKCLVGLGYDICLKIKETFGFFYFYARYHNKGLKKNEYEKSIALFDNYFYDTAEATLKKISNDRLRISVGEDIFSMCPVLKDFADDDHKQKYLIMLYRFASLTAITDGNIGNKEAEWISKILSLSPKKPEKEDVVIFNEVSNFDKAELNVLQKVKPNTSKLMSLIGLRTVKEEINTLTNFLIIQKEREAKGLKYPSISYHCIFTGNPGTGKTTVARIVADIYKSLGIIRKGHLVETDRSGLVAEYVGQTAIKTNKIIDSALDGILFIDEAYSLVSQGEGDYGKEAIATLLKRMEDERGRLVVILAGYSTEMPNFINSNPGLQSRFNRYIEFSDYSAEELFEIFELNLKQFDYTITSDAKTLLKGYFIKTIEKKDRNFGNARFIRNLFEKTIEKQANRLSKEAFLTENKLSEICSVDLPI